MAAAHRKTESVLKDPCARSVAARAGASPRSMRRSREECGRQATDRRKWRAADPRTGVGQARKPAPRQAFVRGNCSDTGDLTVRTNSSDHCPTLRDGQRQQGLHCTVANSGAIQGAAFAFRPSESIRQFPVTMPHFCGVPSMPFQASWIRSRGAEFAPDDAVGAVSRAMRHRTTKFGSRPRSSRSQLIPDRPSGARRARWMMTSPRGLRRLNKPDCCGLRLRPDQLRR